MPVSWICAGGGGAERSPSPSPSRRPFRRRPARSGDSSWSAWASPSACPRWPPGPAPRSTRSSRPWSSTSAWRVPPGVTVLGSAVIVAIGAGAVAGGAGGGGGAAFFLWHPATVSIAAKLAATPGTCDSNISRVSPPSGSVLGVLYQGKTELQLSCSRLPATQLPHFQLQFGIVLLPPPWVSCCWSVPSASIIQISVCPFCSR